MLKKNSKNEGLSNREKALLDVKSFFKSIDIIFNSQNNVNSFDENNKPNPQDLMASIKVMPWKIPEDNSLVAGPTLVGSYDKKSLEQYLNAVMDGLKSINKPMGFSLRSSNHCTTLVFSNEKKNWLFTDAGYTEKFSIGSEGLLANRIIKAFSKGPSSTLQYFLKSLFPPQEVAVLSTEVYSLKDNKKSLDVIKNRISSEKNIHINKKNSNGSDSWGNSLLMMASRAGKIEIVKQLLKDSSSFINQKSKDGFTALDHAAMKGHVAIVKELFNAGGKSEFKNKSKLTLMHMVALRGRAEVIKFLNKNGTLDINAKARNDITPLHVAALNNNASVVEALYLGGANLEAKNSNDDTPLHIAARGNNLEVVKKLLSYGANQNQINNQMKTPLDLVKSNKDNKNTLAEHQQNIQSKVKAVQEKYLTPLKQFKLKHKEKLEKSLATPVLGAFRKTSINENISLSKIFNHAQENENRSRQVFIELGWMTQGGKYTQTGIDAIAEQSQHEHRQSPFFTK